MAYVPNFKWDIFISYAHRDRDNVPEGWISKLKSKLESAVDEGIDSSLKIFFDQQTLPANMKVLEIDAEVRDSAVLVVFASPNWIRSKSCQNEVNAMLAEPNGHGRIFVIEMKPPAGEVRYSPAIEQLIRVEVYRKVGDIGAPVVLRPEDDLFEARLFKIGGEIRNKLIEMRSARVAGRSSAEPRVSRHDAAGKGTVILASCAGEVARAKRDLADYVAAQGHRIESLNASPGDDLGAHKKTVEAKLAAATVFVQLLGPEDYCCDKTGTSINQLEIAAAREQGVRIMLWRPNWLDPHGIDDDAHRALVQSAQNGPAVPELANSILEALAAALATPSAVAGQSNEPHFVLVSSAPEDSDLAGELVGALNEPGVYACNDNAFAPDKAREVWASCDAIAYLQAQSDPLTMFARLQAIHKERATAQVDRALLGQAAVYGPPPGKPRAIGGGGIAQLDLSSDWDPDRFCDWVRSILADRGG